MAGQPKSGTTLRTDLMEMMEEINFSDLNLVADKLAPPVPVTERSATYPVLPREVRMKVPDTRRAPNGTYTRGQWQWGSDLYTTEEFGYEEDVDLTQAMENEKFVREEEIAAQLSVEGLLKAREARVAAGLLNTTTFTGATNLKTLTNEWDDAANATPYADIEAVFQILREKNGLSSKSAYSLILSDDNFKFGMRTNEVLNSMLYTEPVQKMTQDRKLAFFADYLGIKEVILTSEVYDTTGYGRDAVVGKHWTNEFGMLAKLCRPGQSWKEPGVARQPVWSRFSTDYMIEDYGDSKTNKWIYRAREYRGLVVNTDYGVLIENMKTTVSATTGI